MRTPLLLLQECDTSAALIQITYFPDHMRDCLLCYCSHLTQYEPSLFGCLSLMGAMCMVMLSP